MNFQVRYASDSLNDLRNTGILIRDNWDDWFKYQTAFTLIIFDAAGQRYDLGQVKIGEAGLRPARAGYATKGERTPEIPITFEELDEKFFSLGQDEDYYKCISEMPLDLRKVICTALRDCAYDLSILESYRNEEVASESILRSVSFYTVQGRFNRLSNGNAELTPFSFDMALQSSAPGAISSIDFRVSPESFPPTNMHVLIGRNGVGKTTSLGRLTNEILEQDNSEQQPSMTLIPDSGSSYQFSSLISVAFSAFDPFLYISDSKRGNKGLRYAYVGLKKTSDAADGLKSMSELTEEFIGALKICSKGVKYDRLQAAFDLLKADPLFAEADMLSVMERDLETLETTIDEDAARSKFQRLSSGHKIVILTMTLIASLVDESSLVLIDEPEAHLHPPLIAAFLRALSALLHQRNGVALIATHSPVVLQEVPRSCVWRINRSGMYSSAERPRIETFGENIGILTREIFKLEVTKTGFHRMLVEAIRDGVTNYDDLLKKFNYQLGSEAKSIGQFLVTDASDENESEQY